MMEYKNNRQFYTVEQVVSSCYLYLDSEDSRDELVFREWIYDALREIGPPQTGPKKVCLEVKDFCIEKPQDLAALQDMNLLDSSNGIFFFEFRGNGILNSELRQNTDGSISADRLSTLGGTYSIVVSEQERTYELSSNATGVFKAELLYYPLPINEDGDMIIPEDHKLACISYVEWNYLKRERNRSRRRGNLVPQSEVSEAYSRWINKQIQVKGRNKMPNTVEFGTIARKWVSMIPKFTDKRMRSTGNTFRYRL